jgi:hypothetical protein
LTKQGGAVKLKVDEFIEQIKEGSSRQRELLKMMLSTRITLNVSSEEKLEIARTCVISHLEYYRKDQDCPVDDYIALCQLSQLLMYCDSWEQLRCGICLEDDL